jgi:hypothetical protein
MNTTSVSTGSTGISIPAEHAAAATRYIAEIARRDALAFLGPDYEAERTSQLWDQFVTAYESVAFGPYARRGRDAIIIALGKL